MRVSLYSSAFAVVSLFLCSGCGSSSSSGISLKLKVAAVARNAPRTFAHRTVQTNSRSFTPTSMKLPIMKISIAKLDGSNAQDLYQCPRATEAECLVDLASQTELDMIATAAQGLTLEPGTYDQVMLNTCVPGTSGSTPTTAKVTGGATGPNGTNWATSATTVVDTTGAGVAEETTVGNWSCSMKTVIVRTGITVGSGPLTLTIVVDNYMAAVFGDMVSPGMGGCAVAPVGGQNGFCLTYPALMAYVGTDTVTTNRFTITHQQGGDPSSDAAANALIIVAVTGSGTPLIAYGRTLFTATSETVAANTLLDNSPSYTPAVGGPSYVSETNVESFVAASNTSIAFIQGGSADTFAAKFTAFNPSASHFGTVMSRDELTTWNYGATLLP